MAHDSEQRRKFRRLRRDEGGEVEGTLVTYQGESGEEPLQGDEHGLFVKPVGASGGKGSNLSWEDTLNGEEAGVDKPATLYHAFVHNNSGTDRFIQVHNLADTPGAGVAPNTALVYAVPANQTLSISIPEGRDFELGIQVVFSSTFATYTAVGANVGSIAIGYA